MLVQRVACQRERAACKSVVRSRCDSRSSGTAHMLTLSVLATNHPDPLGCGPGRAVARVRCKAVPSRVSGPFRSTNIYQRAYLDRDPSFYLNLVRPTGRLLPYRVPHEGDAETHSRRCSSSHDGARARVAPGASPPASGRSLAAPAPSAPHGSPAGSRRGRTFGDRPHVRRQTPVSTRS